MAGCWPIWRTKDSCSRCSRRGKKCPNSPPRARTRSPRKRRSWTLRSSPMTLPGPPVKENWTRWWAATRKLPASSRFWADGKRTIPCSSANPAWARAPSWKALRSASPPATSPPRWPRNASCPWTSRPWWPAPNTVAILKNASRASSRKLPRIRTSSYSLTSSTPSWVPAALPAAWTRPICSNLRSRAGSFSASAPPPWTNSPRLWRKTAPWTAVSRRLWWNPRTFRSPSPSCSNSGPSTRNSTVSLIRTRPWRPPYA